MDVAEVVSGLVEDRFGGVASGGNLLRKSASVGPLCCTPDPVRNEKRRFLSGGSEESSNGQMPSNVVVSSRLPGISYLMEAEFHFAAASKENSVSSAVVQEKTQPLMSGAERGKFFQEQNFLVVAL